MLQIILSILVLLFVELIMVLSKLDKDQKTMIRLIGIVLWLLLFLAETMPG
jgi:hypothetical protein